jgi:hypothetical protein
VKDHAATPDLVRTAVTAAAQTGTTIRIIYHGGSQPGAMRDVRPLEVTAEDLRALDVAAGIAKTFVLSRIELPGVNTLAAAYVPRLPGQEDEGSLGTAMRAHVPALEAAGWHVLLSADGVAVHGLFKNGKLRKTAEVFLGYTPLVHDGLDPNEEGVWVETFRPSARPYYNIWALAISRLCALARSRT